MEKMKRSEQIEKFIRETFELYGLSYKTFFSKYDAEEGKDIELPMVLNGKLVMPIVERAAMCLGISENSLLSMDYNTIRKRYDRYPYFRLVQEYYHAYNESYFDESAKYFLCRVIFSDKESLGRKTYFDYDDVKKRLLVLIHSYGTDFPNLNHVGQDLSYLQIKTETIFQYERFGDLLRAYLDMFQCFKAFFFKALKTGLSDSEIAEYNFLVSCLGIRDRIYKNDTLLYYDLLKAFAPIYKKEEHQDIFPYIKICEDFVPPLWKCANLADFPDLAKQFTEVVPNLKSKLRKTVMEAKNYRCAYLWSDEEKPAYEPDFELFLLKSLHKFGDSSVGSHYHYLYVPKTAGELSDAGEQIKRLSILAGPEKLGGLPMPQESEKVPFSETIKGLQARIAAAPKMKWGVNLYE